MTVAHRAMVYGVALLGASLWAFLSQVDVMDGRGGMLEPLGILVYVGVVWLGLWLGPELSEARSTEPKLRFEHDRMSASWTTAQPLWMSPQAMALSSFGVVIFGAVRHAFMGGGLDWETGWFWAFGWMVLLLAGAAYWRHTVQGADEVVLKVSMDSLEIQGSDSRVVLQLEGMAVTWNPSTLLLSSAGEDWSMTLSASPAARELVDVLSRQTRRTVESKDGEVPEALSGMLQRATRE